MKVSKFSGSFHHVFGLLILVHKPSFTVLLFLVFAFIDLTNQCEEKVIKMDLDHKTVQIDLTRKIEFHNFEV